MTTAEQGPSFAPGHTSAPDAAGWAGVSRDALAARFEELAALNPDWDSYGARSVDPDALRQGQLFVEWLLQRPIPIPSIFPVPDGGVQLEWAAGAVELEVEIEPGAAVGVFVCDDRDAGHQIDGELPRDEGLFRIALERLAAYA
ncbi:MAG: hypothetical protein H0V79_11190 [Actinobacteria bacterium]|nr:hypothetical protein [Actinomycetota bacterium]